MQRCITINTSHETVLDKTITKKLQFWHGLIEYNRKGRIKQRGEKSYESFIVLRPLVESTRSRWIAKRFGLGTKRGERLPENANQPCRAGTKAACLSGIDPVPGIKSSPVQQASNGARPSGSRWKNIKYSGQHYQAGEGSSLPDSRFVRQTNNSRVDGVRRFLNCTNVEKINKIKPTCTFTT